LGWPRILASCETVPKSIGVAQRNYASTVRATRDLLIRRPEADHIALPKTVITLFPLSDFGRNSKTVGERITAEEQLKSPKGDGKERCG
jgi:hypothetical protein